jgi:hypothetical protein
MASILQRHIISLARLQSYKRRRSFSENSSDRPSSKPLFMHSHAFVSGQASNGRTTRF